MLEESQLHPQHESILKGPTGRFKIASALSAVPPSPRPSPRTSACMVSYASSPPTGANEIRRSAGFALHVLRLFAGTLPARTHSSHTTDHIVSPDAETFSAQMAGTVSRTMASETAPRKKTTARQLLSLLLPPLPNPHRGR